jgi:pSer/pThr/pTyr-binding forkhead associated (FHA) protein
LSSTNGTFVNEKRIDKYELLDGDEIIIGKHSLLFNFMDNNCGRSQFDETMVLDTKKQKQLLEKNR